MASDALEHDTLIIEEERLKETYTRMPNTILRRADLSPGAKLAYMALLSYAHERDRCFPGQERLASDLGVSKRSVITYLQELQRIDLLRVTRRGLGRTNVYVLATWIEPRSAKFALPEVQPLSPPEVQILHVEKTLDRKEKSEKDESNFRKVAPPDFGSDRQTILAYVDDFARELADQASLKASTTRALNLFRRSGRDLESFIAAMLEARAIAKERTASIRSTIQEPGRPFATKVKMPYFFEVLEDRLGLKEGPVGPRSPERFSTAGRHQAPPVRVTDEHAHPRGDRRIFPGNQEQTPYPAT